MFIGSNMKVLAKRTFFGELIPSTPPPPYAKAF